MKDENTKEKEFLLMKETGSIDNNFFYQNNKLIYSSSIILEYVINNLNDKELILNFENCAYTTHNLELIYDKNIEFTQLEYERKTILFNNIDILKRALKKYPVLFRTLKVSQINKEVIRIIESNIDVLNISREDMEKYPVLFNSIKITNKVLKENPDIILIMDDLTDEIVDSAIEYGFVPTKQNFYDRPNLRNFLNLLKIAFEKDPSIIIFFDEESIKYTFGYLASVRGYKITEEDLIFNPNLGASSNLMMNAIADNPYLIKYVRQGCYLKDECILKALDSYKITEEDILNHPGICKSQVIKYLPEFELYNYYLSEERKVEYIYQYLKEGKSLTELPFFSSILESRINPRLLDEIWEIINIEINESDSSLESYTGILNGITDSITLFRYQKNRYNFLYSNIIDLNNDIIYAFKSNNILYILDNIYNFAGNMIPYDKIYSIIMNFYSIYCETGTLDVEQTYDFCNYILNLNRNYYLNEERKKIINEFKRNIELSERKLSSIKTSIKIPIITDKLKRREYDSLGTTLEEINALIDEVENKLCTNRDIIKAKINISKSQFDIIRNDFIENGCITLDLASFLNISDKSIARYIEKKYNNIRIKYLDSIQLEQSDIDEMNAKKDKLDLNSFNYKIVSKDRYIRQIAILFSTLNNETAYSILGNVKDVKRIKDTLPFVGISEDFNVEVLTNILVNYGKIKEKVFVHQNIYSFNINAFTNMLSLASGYSSINDTMALILNPDIINEIGVNNLNEFLEFYKNMLLRKGGNIPSVNLNFDNYICTSGQFSDPERLLIGRINGYSCIDLTSAGKETFKECLLYPTGDAILIRDSNNKLISRILVIRRGNTIQFILKSGTKYSIELYRELASQILDKAIAANDNIDYIFVSKVALKETNLDTISDSRFKSKFPHADLTEEVVMVDSKSNHLNIKEDNLEIDFGAKAQVEYAKERQPIDCSPSPEKITRLRALKILLTDDELYKEILIRNFEPFYSEDYTYVVCGEDWYLALRKDGKVIEEILNDGDTRAYEELSRVKEYLSGKNNQFQINLRK